MENQAPNSAPVADVQAPVEASQPEATQENLNTSEETQESPEAEVVQEKKRIKQIKLKVDGKEFMEDLPFEIDDSPEIVEYVQKQLQLAKMAQKRAAEASDLKKKQDDISNYLEEIKGSPAKFRELARSLGISEKDLAADILNEEIEQQKKSPDQIEKEKLQMELQKLQDERRQEKEAFEKQQFERMQQQAFTEYNTAINEAIASSDLPETPYVIKKMAELMHLGLENNIDVKPKDIIEIVRQDIIQDLQGLIGKTKDDNLEAFIGKDTLKRLKKRTAVKLPEAPMSAVKDTGSAKKESKPASKVSFKDYFKI